MPHADYIIASLAKKLEPHADLTLVRVGAKHIETWAESGLDRFGVMAPYRLRRAKPVHWHVKVCPEVIVDQTSFLENGELEIYLESMAFWIHTLRDCFVAGQSGVEAERLAEEKIYEAAPALLQALTSVQLRALDASR